MNHVPPKSVIQVSKNNTLVSTMGCQEEKVVVGCSTTKKSVVTLKAARHVSMTHNMHNGSDGSRS